MSVGTEEKNDIVSIQIIPCNLSLPYLTETTYLKVRQDTRQQLLWRKVLERRIHALGKLIQSRRRQRITQIQSDTWYDIVRGTGITAIHQNASYLDDGICTRAGELRVDVVWPLELYRDFLVPRRIVLVRGEGRRR